MGLFSKIVKAVIKPVKKVVPKFIVKPIEQVAKVLDKAPKAAVKVVQTGVKYAPFTLLKRAAGPKAAPYLDLAATVATTFIPGGPLLKAGLTVSSALNKTFSQPKQIPVTPQGGGNMGLDVGGLLKSVSGIFGGNQNQIFSTVSNVAGLASQFFPTAGPTTALAVRPPMPTTPAVASAMRAVPMVGRGFFNRFPNLATSLQALRARGANVSRGKLWSLLKRFGPDILITGGILTAAAVSELMVAGPGHRRMNPANVKALRRSMRRLESFHKLCVTADRLRAPRRKACKTSRGGSQQFVRQG